MHDKEITIRELNGGYYVKLNRAGEVKEWAFEDKKKVMRIVRREFFEELTPAEMRQLQEGLREEKEKKGDNNLKFR